MRVAALTVMVALVVTAVPAAGTNILTPEDHLYIVTGPEGGVGREGPVLQNGATFFPGGGTRIIVAVDDAFSPSVHVRICHEWTYDDGSHPTVVCTSHCSEADEALRFPTSGDVTYRLVVDLRKGPGACDAKPVSGTLHAVIR